MKRVRRGRQAREDLSPGFGPLKHSVASVPAAAGVPPPHPVESHAGASQPTHLFLLPPLPAQLSVGGRHGLDHEGGGHVAAAGKEEGKCIETFKIIRRFYSSPGEIA